MTEVATLERALARAVGLLDQLGRAFALVGGLAVSAHGLVRFTRDVDLAVAVVDDVDAEQVVRRFREAGYRIAAIVEQEGTGRLATVRLVDSDGVKVDLLFASSGLEPDIAEHAVALEVPGVGLLPVAVREDLIATKILSMAPRRLQDRLDLQHLLLLGDTVDLTRVRSNLALISSRGFDRGEALEDKLLAVLNDLQG
jgi:hypothetical protein